MSRRDSPNAVFLSGHVPAGAAGAGQLRDSAIYSVITHGFAALVLVWLVANPPAAPGPSSPATRSNVVWIGDSGAGGGGGGGGNRMAEPARKAQRKGDDKVDVPAATAQIAVPVVMGAAGLEDAMGLVASALAIPGPSQGPGSDGGAGTGKNGGIGGSIGTGVNDGFEKGTGGGWYRPGTNGVSMPEVIYEKKPEYTVAAVTAKVQGTVEVEALVNADGTVKEVRVVRSVDDRFGLDEQAVAAVRQWRFRPALKDGRPVPVRVLIELTFRLR